MARPVTTEDQVLCVSGKVFYNDRRRRIDLKRPIKNLIEGRGLVRYNMELCLSPEKVHERLQQLQQKRVMPVLLYFTEEEQ